jgi:hypothetical protein
MELHARSLLFGPAMLCNFPGVSDVPAGSPSQKLGGEAAAESERALGRCSPQQLECASVTAIGSWQCAVCSPGPDSLDGELLRDTRTRRCRRLGTGQVALPSFPCLLPTCAWLVPACPVTHARDSTRREGTRQRNVGTWPCCAVELGTVFLYSDRHSIYTLHYTASAAPAIHTHRAFPPTALC